MKSATQQASYLRGGVWFLHIGLPLFGVWILLASGNIGSEDLRNFTAIGDAVNVAARLEAMAEPGEIVVGQTTAALIRHVAVP